MLKRALIRADIKVWYSEGFNPRPRLTLPLPRSVGVESECELLCAQIECESEDSIPEKSELKEKLNPQLPGDIELVSLDIEKGSISYYPEWVDYFLPVDFSLVEFDLKAKIEQLQSKLADGVNVFVNRFNHKKKTSSTVSLNNFIESVSLKADGVYFRCLFTPFGTVKIPEMLEISGLETEMLSGPVKRFAVGWVKK